MIQIRTKLEAWNFIRQTGITPEPVEVDLTPTGAEVLTSFIVDYNGKYKHIREIGFNDPLEPLMIEGGRAYGEDNPVRCYTLIILPHQWLDFEAVTTTRTDLIADKIKQVLDTGEEVKIECIPTKVQYIRLVASKFKGELTVTAVPGGAVISKRTDKSSTVSAEIRTIINRVIDTGKPEIMEIAAEKMGYVRGIASSFSAIIAPDRLRCKLEKKGLKISLEKHVTYTQKKVAEIMEAHDDGLLDVVELIYILQTRLNRRKNNPYKKELLDAIDSEGGNEVIVQKGSAIGESLHGGKMAVTGNESVLKSRGNIFHLEEDEPPLVQPDSVPWDFTEGLRDQPSNDELI